MPLFVLILLPEPLPMIQGREGDVSDIDRIIELRGCELWRYFRWMPSKRYRFDAKRLYVEIYDDEEKVKGRSAHF